MFIPECSLGIHEFPCVVFEGIEGIQVGFPHFLGNLPGRFFVIGMGGLISAGAHFHPHVAVVDEGRGEAFAALYPSNIRIHPG